MNPTPMKGLNRTGLAASPKHGKELAECTELTVPSAVGTADDLLAARADYAREGDLIGSVPPPASGRQVLGMAKELLKGESPLLLIDKLGERLAFERTGTRLYDGLLLKHDVYGTWDGGPTRAELEQHRLEEHQHFRLVAEAIRTLGGDPTAVTPSANVHAVTSEGVLKVVTDPRTTLQHSLEAILIAELADNDCWANLVQLARAAGHAFAADFEQALREEQRHLEHVRGWLAAKLGVVPKATPRGIAEAMVTNTRVKPARRNVSRGRKTTARKTAAKRSTARRAASTRRPARRTKKR